MRLSLLRLLVLLGLPALSTSHAQTPPIYYLRPTTNAYQLARIGADGAGDQLIQTGLPAPSFPAWSKDGSLLALTSPHPQRPSKISQDVFAFSPATGTTRLIVPFEDQTTVEPVFSGGIKVGERNKFSYVIPIYKAFSPDRTRIVVSSLVNSGFYQTQQPLLDSLSGVSQTPLLQIYRVADGAPQEVVVLGRVRTFYTLGGFGVDWHPTQNVIVASVDTDGPTVGAQAPSESAALLIIEAVPNALTSGRYRQITRPQGLYQITQFGLIQSTQSDYAPAFSPDGQTIAYLRAENTVDGSGSVVQHRPVSVTIRAVNFDGSNDRAVLQLAQGIFSSQVTWSPNGQQLTFDTGRQPTPQPLQLAKLEATPSTLELSIVNLDGSNPHPIRGPAAGTPAWQPGPVVPTTPRLSIQLTPGNPPSLAVSWPTTAQSVTLESSPTLGTAANWRALQLPIQAANGQSRVAVPLSAASGYLRLRWQ